MNQILSGDFELSSLSKYEYLRVTKQFSDQGKDRVAKYIEKLDDDRFEELVGKNIRPIIERIAKHFGFA